MKKNVGWTLASVLWLPVAIGLVLVAFAGVIHLFGEDHLQMELGDAEASPDLHVVGGVPAVPTLAHFRLAPLAVGATAAAYSYAGLDEPQPGDELLLRMRTTPAALARVLAADRMVDQGSGDPRVAALEDEFAQAGLSCPAGGAKSRTVHYYVGDFTSEGVRVDLDAVVDRSDPARPFLRVHAR